MAIEYHNAAPGNLAQEADLAEYGQDLAEMALKAIESEQEYQKYCDQISNEFAPRGDIAAVHRATHELLIKAFGANIVALIPKAKYDAVQDSMNMAFEGTSCKASIDSVMVSYLSTSCTLRGPRNVGRFHGDVRADQIQGIVITAHKALAEFIRLPDRDSVKELIESCGLPNREPA